MKTANLKKRLLAPLLLVSMTIAPSVIAQQDQQKPIGPIDVNETNSWSGNFKGRINFNLTDAPGLARLDQDYKSLQRQINQNTRAIRPLRQQLRTLRQQKNALNSQIALLERQIAGEPANKAALITQRDTKKAQVRTKNTEIKAKQDLIQPLRATRTNLLNQEKQKAQALRERRQNLINRVLVVNAEGVEEGREDGRQDGRIVARENGINYGKKDGYNDGRNNGISDGQNNARNQGLGAGRIAGANRAQGEGEANGIKNGTYDGNVTAATAKGESDGLHRANNSNAAELGKAEGRQDGLQRAINTGNRRGTAQGESEAVQKYESQRLDSKSINGDYAGAFDKIIPGLPDNYRGDNFSPNLRNIRRDFIKKAYRAGYRFRYRRALRNTYDRRIAEIYNRAYDNEYQDAYDDFVSRRYQDSYDAGFEQAETQTFNANYPGIYNTYYSRYKSNFSNNPNRNSSEYRSTYREVENNVYEDRFNEIKTQNYNETEASTFNQNIEAQTKKYRDQRYAQVQAVYENKPVLKFVGSTIADGGVNGVAKADNVFQPNETIIHSLTLKNYGKKAANDAKVIIDGQTVNLPTIGAQSEVTIKGAITSIVNGNNGNSISKSLAVSSPLTTEAALQGRHYSNTAQNIITSDRKRINVSYPLALSGLRSDSPLIINQEQSLNLNIQNNSSREYTGPIKVELTSSSNEAVVSGFGDVQRIKSSTSIKDARVKVSDLSQIYTPISFTVKISKNGVTLGESTQLQMLTKAPYQDQEGKPVVIVNSDQNARDLLDLMSKMGGLSQVSILDTSLSQLNASVLSQGVHHKTLLVINGYNNATLKSFQSGLNKSQGSSIIVIDNERDFASAQTSVTSFYGAPLLNIKVKGLNQVVPFAFLNQRVDQSGVKTPTIAIKAYPTTFQNFLFLAESMRLHPTYLFQRISQVNRTQFYSPSVTQAQTLQSLNIRMLGEVLRVSLAYRIDKDSKEYRQIERDQNMLHNQFMKALDAPVSEANIALSLLAFDSNRILKNALNSSSVEAQLGNRVESKFRRHALRRMDRQERKLKDNVDRDFYRYVKDQGHIYTLFQ